MQETGLKSFGGKITELMQEKDFSREEIRELFSQILLNEQTDMHQGAFMAALSAKGETAEEIAGVWDAIYELDTVKVRPDVDGPIVDNCGTGMDSFKTFNISTAASLIAAAGGVTVARHGARAVTSACGTVDIVEALGVDVECDPDLVKRSIETVGIGLFNGMSPAVHPQALGRILSQIRFGTTLNIAGSLANPALPHYGVRGVYSPDLVEPVARVMREIGYRRALVVYGDCGNGSGMDECSTLGESIIAELEESGDITVSVLRPGDFGIAGPDESAIRQTGDLDGESLRLLKIVGGIEKGSRYDIVCLNAAPVFYVDGKAESLSEGFAVAREIADSGSALETLKHWVAVQNRYPEEGLKKLEGLLARL